MNHVPANQLIIYVFLDNFVGGVVSGDKETERKGEPEAPGKYYVIIYVYPCAKIFCESLGLLWGRTLATDIIDIICIVVEEQREEEDTMNWF